MNYWGTPIKFKCIIETGRLDKCVKDSAFAVSTSSMYFNGELVVLQWWPRCSSMVSLLSFNAELYTHSMARITHYKQQSVATIVWRRPWWRVVMTCCDDVLWWCVVMTCRDCMSHALTQQMRMQTSNTQGTIFMGTLWSVCMRAWQNVSRGRRGLCLIVFYSLRPF